MKSSEPWMEFSLDIFGTIKIQPMSRYGIKSVLNKHIKSSTFGPTIPSFCGAQIWIILTLDKILQKEHLCASILVPLCASILGALCIGWVSIKFEVFHIGFHNYRGVIWFSCGLGGENSSNWRAILFQNLPLPLISFQLAVSDKIRVSETLCQRRAF